MVNVTVKGDRELALALDRIKNATPKTLLDIVRRCALTIEQEAKENVSGKILRIGVHPGGKTGGTLRRSITSKIKAGTSPSATIGPGGIARKYAAVHEFGMTIRAKNKPYLRFPIHTFMRIASKSGKRLKRPQKGFSWAMVKQVTIPARPFMATAFKDSLSKIDRIMGEEVDKLTR